MPDLVFCRCGMTMRTPAHSVDLVPVFRRIGGDKEALIIRDEKSAAILALTHLGFPTDQVRRAMKMSNRDVRAVLSRYGMDPIASPEPEQIAWTSVAYKSRKAAA